MDVLLYFMLGAAFVLALAYLYRSKMSTARSSARGFFTALWAKSRRALSPI